MSDALHPQVPTKLLFIGVAVFFTLAAAEQTRRIAAGSIEWTTFAKVIVPVVYLLALLMIWAAVLFSRYAVWVDTRANTICERRVLGTQCVSLAAPTTVKFTRTARNVGTRGQVWHARVTSDDGALDISTPMVDDMSELASLLQPAYRDNPGLAADDLSREALEDPDSMSRPTGRGPDPAR